MMGTYFHGGSEIQPPGSDNLQTLYLMNPNYVTAYTSEAPNNNPPNMVLLNPSGGSGPNGLGSPGSLPGHHHHQQFIGIPLAGGPHSETHPAGRPPMVPGGGGSLHGVAVSRVHYHHNLWSPTADPNHSPAHPGPVVVPGLDGDGGGPMGFRRPNTGGLSLSLSPHHQQQQQNTNNNNHNNSGSNNPVGGGSSVSVSNGGGVQGVMMGSKYLKATQELLDEVVNVGSYCNKGVNNNGENSGAHKEKGKGSAANKEAVAGDHQGGESSGGGGKKVAEQLSTAQRQELQMKKAKLLNMLDEVEQRYRQYHTQMQVVVSSFEQAAGIGSAKSYTSLALQTISKQFRCLKDAIVSQIKATSKSLGEDQDSNGGGSSKLEGGGVGSRLRFVDHQLRQQRALQQLGMMQHNAWRPQRGLPERAVSVLRAWLFEHFLHPYPKDSDKHMLAKQTGLTRSQVSNWFINARVRLWKPMVEEMYLEEIKTQEQNGGDSENKSNGNTNTNTNISGPSTGNDPNKDQSTSKATAATQQQQHEQQQDVGNGGGLMQSHQQGDHHVTNDMISNLSAMSTTSMSSQGFTLIGSSSDMESLMARSPKKQRSMQSSPSSILSMDMEMKPPDHHHNHHQNKYGPQDHRQSQSPMIIAGNHDHHHHHQGFNNPYIVNNDMMGRFNPDHLLTAHQYHGNNNGVSLTLGLPHCENHQSLTLSGNPHQQSFIPNQDMQLGRRLDIGGGEDQGEFCGISMGMGQPSHPSNGYESIDIQSRKRFAAHQLLHDFVA